MNSITIGFFNRTVSACLIAAVSLAPGLARAQLEEIVVTAQKREQSIQEVPLSVAAIDTEQLDNNQFRDIREITALVPSVNFQHGFNPAATNYNIRGIGSFAFSAGIQPSTSMVVDGIPYARTGEFVFDLADIEQIEVLRGPQGTLFGRNATGGAISITTGQPTEEFEAELEAGASDDEEYFVRGVVSGPLGDKVRGRVAAMYLDREGFLENFGPSNDLNGQETKAVRAKLDIDLTDDINVLISGNYSDNDHGYNPLVARFGDLLRGAGPGGTDSDAFGGARAVALGNGDAVLGQQILDDPFKIATDFRDDANENVAWGMSADITWDVNDSLRVKSLTAYREFTNNAHIDTDGTPSSVFNPGIFPLLHVTSTNNPRDDRYGFQDTLEYIQTEFRLEGSQERFDWILGGFYQSLDENHTSGRSIFFDIGPFIPLPPGQLYRCVVCDSANSFIDQETIAIFGDVTVHVTDRLDVFGGFRWTEEDVTKTLNSTAGSVVLDIATMQSLTDPQTGIMDLSGFPEASAPRPDAVGSVGDSFDFWSWRGGGSFEFTDTVSVYASASRGWVGPASPIITSDTLGYTTPADPFVDPTKADNYEIGLKSEWLERRLRFNAALFMIDVTGLQTQTVLPGTISPVTVNAGDLDIAGFEMDVTFAATDWLTLRASLAHTDAEIENLIQDCFEDQLTSGTVPGCNPVTRKQDVAGNQATITPKWAYNLNAAFEIPGEGFPVNYFGSLNWSWRDDIQYELNQDDLSIQKSYGLLDFTAGVRDRNGRWEAYVYGKNVTDKFHFNYAIGIPGFTGRQSLMALRRSQAYFGGGVKLFF